MESEKPCFPWDFLQSQPFFANFLDFGLFTIPLPHQAQLRLISSWPSSVYLCMCLYMHLYLYLCKYLYKHLYMYLYMHLYIMYIMYLPLPQQVRLRLISSWPNSGQQMWSRSIQWKRWQASNQTSEEILWEKWFIQIHHKLLINNKYSPKNLGAQSALAQFA